jgi:hypothetical protein
MKNIYGTIGYTVLKNISTNNKIIILADMHDRLPFCTNQTNITDWFKSKFSSSKILLEEVPRDGFDLQELWTNAPHTQELKKLFINNPEIIHAVDIRPYLIPFSWELINEMSQDNFILKLYLSNIDDFFCLKSKYFINKLPNYNSDSIKHTLLGKHFMFIKKNYGNFLTANTQYLNQTIKQIYQSNPYVLYLVNQILDEIMEWYICANIYFNENKPIILHTGLAHSEKIIRWLLVKYNYIIVSRQGINSMEETSNHMSGCIQLPTDIDKQFGGFNGFIN